MPEICRFYGIVIQVYYRDHPPAHFHAVYGEHVAKIAIESLQIIEGFIPPRPLSLVHEWAKLHEQELRDPFESRRELSTAKQDRAASLNIQQDNS